MTTRYEIPQFDIVIECAETDPPGERGGMIVQSGLCFYLGDQDDTPDQKLIAAHVIQALERALLALACAGVDLNAPEFRQKFYEAVEHIADQQFS